MIVFSQTPPHIPPIQSLAEGKPKPRGEPKPRLLASTQNRKKCARYYAVFPNVRSIALLSNGVSARMGVLHVCSQCNLLWHTEGPRTRPPNRRRSRGRGCRHEAHSVHRSSDEPRLHSVLHRVRPERLIGHRRRHRPDRHPDPLREESRESEAPSVVTKNGIGTA